MYFAKYRKDHRALRVLVAVIWCVGVRFAIGKTRLD